MGKFEAINIEGKKNNFVFNAIFSSSNDVINHYLEEKEKDLPLLINKETYIDVNEITINNLDQEIIFNWEANIQAKSPAFDLKIGVAYLQNNQYISKTIIIPNAQFVIVHKSQNSFNDGVQILKNFCIYPINNTMISMV